MLRSGTLTSVKAATLARTRSPPLTTNHHGKFAPSERTARSRHFDDGRSAHQHHSANHHSDHHRGHDGQMERRHHVAKQSKAGAFRQQGHAAPWAFTRVHLAHLGMHGAGIDHGHRRLLCRPLRLEVGAVVPRTRFDRFRRAQSARSVSGAPSRGDSATMARHGVHRPPICERRGRWLAPPQA